MGLEIDVVFGTGGHVCQSQSKSGPNLSINKSLDRNQSHLSAKGKSIDISAARSVAMLCWVVQFFSSLPRSKTIGREDQNTKIAEGNEVCYVGQRS